ncbi:MAG TPA: aldo/keto reductase [Miltoncostaeaceae bacterium]|nr:aldo/keto reductase [Miltoncostaeaceae bacterium]
MAAGTGAGAARAGQVRVGPFTVNRLGFGAMRLTGPGIRGEPERPDEARAVLRRALELGVNLIDTAHSYGPEVSERLIGETLRPYPRDLVIATKSGLARSARGGWYPDCRPEVLTRECERSLELLGLDAIPLFQLHTVDPDVPYEESVGALVDLQRAGKIVAIGVSNVNASQLERAMAVADVASVQNRLPAGEDRQDEVLAICERHGIPFLPWFPLGSGRLARDGREGLDGPGTPAQRALAWLLRRSPLMLPIPGTSSLAHLEENIGAAALVDDGR